MHSKKTFKVGIWNLLGSGLPSKNILSDETGNRSFLIHFQYIPYLSLLIRSLLYFISITVKYIIVDCGKTLIVNPTRSLASARLRKKIQMLFRNT